MNGKNILLIAPGKSIKSRVDEIKQCAKENDCIVVAISFVPEFIECEFIFLSNLKRYKTTFNPNGKSIKLIHTSNICVSDNDPIVVNYSSLLNSDDVILDNSSLMFLNLLAKISPAKVYIAGMDGYDVSLDNYYSERLRIGGDVEKANELNIAISRRLKQLNNLLQIEFITPTKYNF